MSVGKAHWVWLAGLLLAGQALAGPTLNGIYKGELGQIEFTTEDGFVSGRYMGGGACPFEDRRRVVEGQFEGNVLVARVLLCQTGIQCGEDFYDVVAFYNPTENTLVGEVKLAGCKSPALSYDRWIKLKGDDNPRRIPPQKPQMKKKSDAMAAAEFKAAQRLMIEGKYAEARHHYLLGLSFQDRNWAAYMNLGVAEIKLNHAYAAVDALDRARDLQPKVMEIYYNLACAWAQIGDRPKAIDSVKKAIKLKGVDRKMLESEPDFAGLHEDPEWEQVLELASASGATANGTGEH